jgi:CPA1 family monovalent cation:H+ antiporter
MALSLPAGDIRDTIVAITYGIVVFSILVQGTTLRSLITWRFDKRGSPQT